MKNPILEIVEMSEAKETKQKRYPKGILIEDHDLQTIYSRYGASQETEFVDKFFLVDEITTVLENCGVPIPEEIERDLEHRIKIGYSTKRADLVFEGPDDSVYYFEVMSQSYNGKWDDDHHQQFYLKSTRLSQIYETVHSFAISFKEFDPAYLEEFQQMDNWYAIHLRFNDGGYYADVYGVEAKKQKNAVRNLEKESLGLKYLEIAKGFGWKNRGDKPLGSYLFVGKGWNGMKYRGIEWVMSSREGRIGIKLQGNLYKEEPFRTINMDPDKITSTIESRVPGVKFLPPKNSSKPGERDRAYYFEYDKEDYSEQNLEKLRLVTEVFAEVFGLSDLLG